MPDDRISQSDGRDRELSYPENMTWALEVMYFLGPNREQHGPVISSPSRSGLTHSYTKRDGCRMAASIGIQFGTVEYHKSQ